MEHAPGYRKRPDHKIIETYLGHEVRVTANGETLAKSSGVIRVDEDGHRARYYFPRDDVRFELLDRSQTTTHCPFKGTASYFNVKLGNRTLPDAIWSYEDPYEEHRGLMGRLAFYEEKFPELVIHIDD